MKEIDDVNQFTYLTRYISILDNDEYANWKSDNQSNISEGNLAQLPFVVYSIPVHSFIEDVNHFNEDHKEFQLIAILKYLSNTVLVGCKRDGRSRCIIT